MNKYFLFLALLISTHLKAVIMNAIKLKHSQTGKIVYLFGDIHFRTELDQKQFNILIKFLKKNFESDIFIDGFQNFSQVNPLVIATGNKLLSILREKKMKTYIRKAKELFKEIRKFSGKKIEYSDLQLGLFRPKIYGCFDLDYFRMNNLLIKITRYCNTKKGIDVISDIRVVKSKEGVFPQETLLQKNIQGIKEEDKKFLKENLPIYKPLLDNYTNKPDKHNQGLITHHMSEQAKKSIDFLELDIVDHLVNDPEKPLIAIIGASHVSKLYLLLISEAFGYQVDKSVKFDPNDINLDYSKKLLSEAQHSSIKELWKPFIEDHESYFVIKRKTVAEFSKKFKQVSQFFSRSIQALDPEELNGFLK